MTSATPFVTTVDGTRTSYLPLTTAWPSAGPECAAGVYQQIGGTFLGWDPFYAQSIDIALTTCWPPEASTWYSAEPAVPTIVLGTVFKCPEAYYEAHTSTLDSLTTQTICCPSHYSLNIPDFSKATFPSLCTSTVTAQQSLTWQDLFFITANDVSWTITSTVVPDSSTLTVFGWHVNGLNVVASSTATPTSAAASPTGTATDTTGSTSAPSSTSTSGTTSNATTSTGNNSTNVGVIIGATVGVVIGVLLVALAAFLVWRKRRAGRRRGVAPEQPQKSELYSTPSPETGAPHTLRSELPGVNRPAELSAYRSVHELPH